MTPEQIAKIADPKKRALEAHAFVQRGDQALKSVRQVRDLAVVELRIAGWSQRAVADLLDLSPGMIAFIDKANGVVSQRQAVKRAD